MMKSFKFIVSIINSIFFPFIVFVFFYSLLNFVNYIFAGSALNFIYRNLIIICLLLCFIILTILLVRYNLTKNIFTDKNFIFLAWIGQFTSFIIFCAMFVFMIFMPLFGYVIFLTVFSQLYFYGLFKSVEIPWILNIIIFIFVTILAFMISSILPLFYTEKAITNYNKRGNDKISNENIAFINHIKMLYNISKLRKIIYKCPNVT